MIRKPVSAGSTATLNLTLGIFLKLLGFFVVLYIYTDTDPGKAHLAEESLKDRFHLSVSLVPENSGVHSDHHTSITRGMGKSFSEIDATMKAQIDFLSSEYHAYNHRLVLRMPADIALDIDGNRARSVDFVSIFTDILQQQKPLQGRYQIEAVVSGSDKDGLMRSISLFVQKMVAHRYAADDLMIGYHFNSGKPFLELRISEVRS